jgi:hypothetical protein
MRTHDWKKSDLPDVAALWGYTVTGGGGPGMGWSIDYIVYETTHPDLVLMVVSSDDNPVESAIHDLEPDDDIPVWLTHHENFYYDDGDCVAQQVDTFTEFKRDSWMTEAVELVTGRGYKVPEDERPQASSPSTQ